VPRNGYVWWYVDGLSADGRHGITVIAFIGSVFSPYYARARRRGAADPENHVALNVVLYGPRSKRWAMTERGRAALACDRQTLRIGPSALTLDGGTLVIRVDETAVPLPAGIKGEIRLQPLAACDHRFALDASGRHRWSPLAPHCRLEVAFERPDLAWAGEGYLDRNDGDAPLEADFDYWDWSRARLPGRTVILYDVIRRDRSRHSIALSVADSGGIEDFVPPPRRPLPANLWQVPRSVQADVEASPGILRTFEHTPFYSRSLIRTRLLGHEVTAMHESLSLDRFRQPWVRLLLPFRMPRRTRF
jgi:carotenoid 1,2-hydratase